MPTQVLLVVGQFVAMLLITNCSVHLLTFGSPRSYSLSQYRSIAYPLWVTLPIAWGWPCSTPLCSSPTCRRVVVWFSSSYSWFRVYPYSWYGFAHKFSSYPLCCFYASSLYLITLVASVGCFLSDSPPPSLWYLFSPWSSQDYHLSPPAPLFYWSKLFMVHFGLPHLLLVVDFLF